MKPAEAGVEYSWASSTASLITTATGMSVLWDSSKLAMRKMDRPAVGQLLQTGVDVALVVSRAGDQGVGVGLQGEFLSGQQLVHRHAFDLGLIEKPQGPLPHLMALRPGNQRVGGGHGRARPGQSPRTPMAGCGVLMPG